MILFILILIYFFGFYPARFLSFVLIKEEVSAVESYRNNNNIIILELPTHKKAFRGLIALGFWLLSPLIFVALFLLVLGLATNYILFEVIKENKK